MTPHPPRIGQALRLAVAAAASLMLSAAAPAGPPDASAPPLDPNWPCQQIKIDHMSLATMWGGPPLGKFADDWRNYPKAAALAQQLAQRRVPVAQAHAESRILPRPPAISAIPR